MGNSTRLFMLFAIALASSAAAAIASPPIHAQAAKWNVVEAGAVGDGKADNTVIFQGQLDAAGKAEGGVVEVPAGRFRINGTLSIPAGVTLQGTYRVPPTIQRNAAGEISGSVLLAYAGRGAETGPPFIRLAGNNSAIQGLVVSYPEWKQTDVPPVPYPPCVLSQGTENVGIQDCLFLNAYEAIKLVQAHRHIVRNVTGYPSKRGIYVDECYDIGHIENVHFWPFGVNYEPNNPYCLWVNTQGVAFEFARTDWHYVSNTFCFGYGVGYKFSESKAGSTNGNFLGLGADSCRRAVLVEQAQPPGLLITNGEFVGRWSSDDSVCVEVRPNVTGKVSLVNCSFWGPIDRCVWMRAPGGQFTANSCHFVSWDVRAAGLPAIQLDAGKAMVQGCTFNQEGPHVASGDKVISAILMGNQASGGFEARNFAGSATQEIGNEVSSVRWTPVALLHYRILVGSEGDGRYIRSFHGRETSGDGAARRTARWSSALSRFLLPVPAGKPTQATFDLDVPGSATGPDAGLYVNGKRLAALTEGPTSLTIELPSTKDRSVSVELRSSGWTPRKVVPGSSDDRTLGVRVFAVTVKAKGAPTKGFNANTGK